MKFTTPFLKLPISFDADGLAAEIRALPQSAWVQHPSAFPGNDAVRLITPGGAQTDSLVGAMGPTESLKACAYMMEIMGEIGAVWGRSRLMGLVAGAQVPAHIDLNHYWRTHIRIHIPIITNPDVSFTCGDETVHMPAGECWIFDSFRQHDVQNRGSEKRVHLVLDTVGGGQLGDLIASAKSGTQVEPRKFMPGQGKPRPLMFERINTSAVMSPWEMRCHVRFLADVAQPDPLLEAALGKLERLTDDWAALWAHYGPSEDGLPAYRHLLGTCAMALKELGAERILLSNGVPVGDLLHKLIFTVAVPPMQAPARPGASFVSTRRLAS